MLPSAGDELELKPGGLIIAGVAFVLTRVLVVNVLYPGTREPMLRTAVSLVPLLLGLGTIVYGVSLSVSTHDREYARGVAGWFLVGSLGMWLLVGIGGVVEGLSPEAFLSNGLVANAVVGGGVGGALIGIRSVRNRRQRRQLRQRADRATLLSRLLRHEVLNSLTAIRGHAELLVENGRPTRSWDAIRRNTDRIERAIEDVRFLLKFNDESGKYPDTVDIRPVLDACRARFADRDGTVVFPDEVLSATVRGDSHLETVVGELVAHAMDGTDDPRVEVAVEVRNTTVAVLVSAPGEWLTDPERQALVEQLPEHDDPRVGYGMPITRFLTTQYGGDLSVTERDGEAIVTVELLRTTETAPDRDDHGVDARTLRIAAGIGLVAGVGMGVILQFASGRIGIIGGLYGVSRPLAGWIVHLSHSVVFATLAVAARRRPVVRQHSSSLAGAVTLGIAYGGLLWLIAAGVVMALWLNLVGIPTRVPNLDQVSLVAHLVWGTLLGALVHSRLPE